MSYSSAGAASPAADLAAPASRTPESAGGPGPESGSLSLTGRVLPGDPSRAGPAAAPPRRRRPGASFGWASERMQLVRLHSPVSPPSRPPSRPLLVPVEPLLVPVLDPILVRLLIPTEPLLIPLLVPISIPLLLAVPPSAGAAAAGGVAPPARPPPANARCDAIRDRMPC